MWGFVHNWLSRVGFNPGPVTHFPLYILHFSAAHYLFVSALSPGLLSSLARQTDSPNLMRWVSRHPCGLMRSLLGVAIFLSFTRLCVSIPSLLRVENFECVYLDYMHLNADQLFYPHDGFEREKPTRWNVQKDSVYYLHKPFAQFDNAALMWQQKGRWLSIVDGVDAETLLRVVYLRRRIKWGPSDLMTTVLNHWGVVPGSTAVMYEVPAAQAEAHLGQPGPRWFEDPRLFPVDDAILGIALTVVIPNLKATDEPSMMQRTSVRLYDKTFKSLQGDIYPAVGTNAEPVKPGYAVATWEKNIVFFKCDNTTRAVCALYSVQPLTVFKFESDTALNTKPVQLVAQHWEHSRQSALGLLRGGAPPVKLGDTFYVFSHSSTYLIYVVTLDLSFKITGYTVQPLKLGSGFIFVCGAGMCQRPMAALTLIRLTRAVFIRNENAWLLSTGISQEAIEISKIPHAQLLKGISPIS